MTLWDVDNHQPIGQPLTSHESPVTNVVFRPDGKWLVSGSTDVIKIWGVDTETWQTKACEMVGRNLTRAEWQQFFGERGITLSQNMLSKPLEPEATPISTP